MGILGNTFGLPHLIIILVIILLLFGAPKLPGLAKSVAQSMKIFRNEIKDPNKADSTAGESVDGGEQSPIEVTPAEVAPKAAPKNTKSS